MKLLVFCFLCALLVSTAYGQCASLTGCSCRNNPACGLCINIGQEVATCVAGNENGTITATCGAFIYETCNSADSTCGAATSGCDCRETNGCGLCGISGTNKDGDDVVTGVCVSGTALAPSTVNRTICSVWLTDECTAAEKAAESMAAIAGAIVAVVLIAFGIFWWCFRGRFWWRSTSHKRCCWHPNAVCNGCCCFGPKDPHEPPHRGAGGSRRTAVRVAPCFVDNPCANCAGGDPEKAKKYKEDHPCGCGLACRCYWMPYCCCFEWPKCCVKNCCLDQQPQEGALDKLKNVKNKFLGKSEDEPKPSGGVQMSNDKKDGYSNAAY
eukprot:GCRY01000885.1.p1 GENE.GCRY01000885.1~~GCRY01000885.1.p1  ORF type:complete len:325 (+),score=29.98 GCRY01000885.1:79-1053(+)